MWRGKGNGEGSGWVCGSGGVLESVAVARFTTDEDIWQSLSTSTIRGNAYACTILRLLCVAGYYCGRCIKPGSYVMWGGLHFENALNWLAVTFDWFWCSAWASLFIKCGNFFYETLSVSSGSMWTSVTFSDSKIVEAICVWKYTDSEFLMRGSHVRV